MPPRALAPATLRATTGPENAERLALFERIEKKMKAASDGEE